MGYRSSARLVKVELPIAVPVIAAGLRVAAVSNVSLVSVSALIGVPELGQLFTNGFQLQYYPPIILGIILCVALATVLDVVLVLSCSVGDPVATGGEPLMFFTGIWDFLTSSVELARARRRTHSALSITWNTPASRWGWRP